MKKTGIILILFLALGITLPAQIRDVETTTTSETSWMQRHFFHTIGGTLVLDYFIPPAVSWYYTYETPNGLDSTLYYSRNWGFNLGSVTYDARINLHDFNDKNSISFNIPVALGFGPTEPGGVLSLAYPVLIEYNYGCHSTYNNIDKLGFHVGLGYDLMMTPMIRTDRYREIKQFWGAPMARIGIKGPYKRRNAFIAFQTTLPQKYYDESEQATFTQRLHFKAVIGFLLNYD